MDVVTLLKMKYNVYVVCFVHYKYFSDLNLIFKKYNNPRCLTIYGIRFDPNFLYYQRY